MSGGIQPSSCIPGKRWRKMIKLETLKIAKPHHSAARMAVRELSLKARKAAMATDTEPIWTAARGGGRPGAAGAGGGAAGGGGGGGAAGAGGGGGAAGPARAPGRGAAGAPPARGGGARGGGGK